LGTPGEQKGNPNIPAHLKEILAKTQEQLSAEQYSQFQDILLEFQGVFAVNDLDLGTVKGVEHGIDTGSARPIKQRMRRTPAGFAEEEEGHLKKMLEAGVIQPSSSEWASPPVLIRKRDGTVRWCIDYRALNAVTVKDVYPLPRVDDCLETLAGNSWFSKLDANSAYWQINVREEDRPKTAFLTEHGLFEHVRMGFGLCNAPSSFARAINLILRGLNWKIVLAFLDDILVLGRNFADHLLNLRAVLGRLSEYGVKLKTRKCEFFCAQGGIPRALGE
jgi:hypothetical protein